MISLADDATDLTDIQQTLSPFDYFAQLRDVAPIHWNKRHRAWLVTRYNDVSDGYRDLRLSSNRLKPVRERAIEARLDTIGSAFGLLEKWMVFQDEPDHRRLRGIVHKAFMAQSVARLEPEIRSIVSTEVDALLATLRSNPDDPVDMLSGFASNIPKTVICNMLGIPPSDHEDFVFWTEELSSFIGGIVIDPDRNERAYSAVTALEGFLNRVIQRNSGASDNIISQLLRAENEGQRLTRAEAIATGILLLFGGRGTTASMVVNGLRALLLHPEQFARVRDNPAEMTATVEEIFRWEGHTKLMPRIVGEEFSWHGRDLKKGERVYLCNMSGNRDDSVFADADRFDPTRPNVRRHIAFGTGIHLCLGQALARLQLGIVLQELAERLPPVVMVHPEGEWSRALLRRAQDRLMIRLA